MPNRFAGLLVATAATMALSASVVLAACYSWNLGSQADSGVVTDARSVDARSVDARSVDAHHSDAGHPRSDAADTSPPGPDVHMSTDSSRPPSDAAKDRQTDAGTCSALEEAADAARVLAEECPVVGKACNEYVLDRCHCRVFVGATESGATASYEKIVHAEVEAGCAQDCTPCPAGAKCAVCLETPVGSGVASLCLPCSGTYCNLCP